MKLFYLLILSSSLFLTNCSSMKTNPNNNSDTADTPDDSFDATILIISYDSEDGGDILRTDIASYGAKVIYDYKNFNSIAISIPEDKTIDEAKKHFESVKGVLAVERNGKVELQNSTLD